MALKNLESYIEKRKKRTDEEGTIKSGFVTKTKDSSTDFESNAKSYYVRKYAPAKAAAYLEGVKNYKPAEVHNSEYYSPYYDSKAREQWQKDYDEAFDNEYKKHFQNLAASDRRYGQMNEQVSQGIKNAEKGYQQVIDSRNAYYSQFADEQEYNDYKRNQELLSFDVPAAKQRLEQLKANQPEQYDSSKNSHRTAGLQKTTSQYTDWQNSVKALESEIQAAEGVQQFYADMQDPVKRAEYERLQKEQDDFNTWYEQQNGFTKFGAQAGNVGLNLLYGLGDAGYGVLEMAKNGVGAGVSLLDPYNITGLNPNYEGSAGDVIDDNVQGFIDYAHDIKATQDRFNSYYNQGLKTDLLKATGNEELSDFLGDTISNTANAVAEVIPSMALAYASGGTSLGATAIKGTSGLTKAQAAAKLTQGTLKGLMKNPSFYYTFIREGGSAYNEAKASGADELEATIAMFGTGLPNAMIEIGGGIEALPKDKSVKGIRQWLKNMVKTGSEEGLEEIKQGVVSQLMAKATYAPEMQLFTVGADGIIDPQRMLQEFYGGFVGGAFGGAVGTGINKAVETYNLHDYNKAKKATQIQLAMTYTGVIENLAQQYPDSTLSQLHSEISEMQEKGEAVSEKQYIKLYNAFIEAAKTADTDHKAQLLQSFGSTEQTAKANAVTISKALDGKRLSVKEAQALYNDNGSMRFMEEVLGKKINSVEELVNMSKEGDLQTGNNATTGDNMLDAVLNSHVNMEKGADTLKNAEYQYNNQLSGRISNLVNIGGKQTRIAAIRNSGADTAMTVELEDGTVTDESGIEYSDPVSQAVFQTAAEYDAPLANVFIKGYDGRSSVGTYNRTFDDVVSAARVGLSSAQILNANPLIAQVMSTDTLNQAVSLAQRTVAEEHTAYNIARNERYGGQKRFKGRTVINNSVNKNLAKNERAFADFIARTTGYEVEITNDSQMMAQGEFDSTKGKIIINLARGDFFATAIHELTHYTALNSPAEYEAFKNEIISWLTSKGNLKQYLDKYASMYGDNVATVDDLTEEVVANAAEALIKSEKFLSDLMLDKDFVSHISDNKAKSFIKRVMEKLGSLVKALKSYLKSADVNHSIARDIAQDVYELEKVSELWTKAFKSAAINHSEVQSIAKENTDTESSGDVKYSIIESVTDDEGNVHKNVVMLDTDFFDGISPRNWGEHLKKYVNNRALENPVIFPIVDEKGKKQLLTFAKSSDTMYTANGNRRKVNSELYETNDNISKLAVVHIDEVVEVSEEGNPYYSNPEKNQWIDKKGWLHRNAKVINVRNGNIYELVIDIAKTENGRHILYATKGKIKRIGQADVNSITEKVKGSGLTTYSGKIVAQPRKIVNPDNKNSLPETDSKGKFSLSEPVEQTKDLIAVHNLDEAKLKSVFELGGFAMPSIAVTRADMGHGEFGEISVVFGKETIDPQASESNKVYSSDAWTPTFPTVEYKLNQKSFERLKEVYKKIAHKFGYDEARPLYTYANESDLRDTLRREKGIEGLISLLTDDTKLMQLYLLDKTGQKVAPVTVEETNRIDDTDAELYDYLIKRLGEDVVKKVKAAEGFSIIEYRKKYFNAYGEQIMDAYGDFYAENYGFSEEQVNNLFENFPTTYSYIQLMKKVLSYLENGAETVIQKEDTEATNKKIIETARKSGYDEWIRDLFGNISEKKGIRNNKDEFTNAGNRRGFEALHYEFTLENVVKAMMEQGEKGISTFQSNIFGASAQNYSSISDIKADSGRLQQLSQEEIDEIRKEFTARFNDIVDFFYPKDNWSAKNTAREVLIEAVAKRKTKSGIASYIRKEAEGWANYSDIVVEDLIELVSDISKMPTTYFEAKPQRVVGFEEIKYAVVPDNISEDLKKKLTDNGVSVVEYDQGDELDRVSKLNSLDDVKFSLPESDTASYDILARENEDLKAQVEALENEMKLTKGHKVKPEAVKKLARKLLREYSSTMDVEELSAELEKIFNYVADTENASADIASKAMYSLAKRIINESRSLDTTLSDQYRNVTEYLRKTKIRVSPGMESELAYLYGSYNDFRKSNFGRLSLSRDNGSAIDSVWQELNSLAPELFPEEAFPDSDMLPRIAEALDMIAPEYVNPYGQDTDSFVSGLASEIFDSYFDTPEIRTFADKKAAELRKAVNKSRQHLAQLRAKDKARYQERYEKLKTDSKEKLNAVKADNKRKTAEKLLKQKAKYQNMAREKAEKQRETAEKSKLRHRIEKNSKTMMKWLNENSDKHHVPEVLRETTATFLSALDFVSFQQRANERKGKVSQSTASWNEALRRLKDIISDYIPNDNGETKAPDFELDIDPDFMDRLSEFIRLETMPVKPIPEMNSEQLREIDYIVTVLKSAITTANSFYLNRMAQNVAEIGNATISELQAKKSKQLNNNAVDKLLNMHMLDSYSFFRELGPAAESIYAEIREGFNKRVRCIEQAQKYMQELLKDVDVSDWTGDKATVHTFKINGEELKMTTAQMMSLYELWKRKQAQEHITKGGIVPTEIKLGKKLLNKVFGAVEPVRLSETDLVRIFSELTPQQREIADKMQKFLSENCSDWGNEVSMAMYGYRKFTEPDYFPIKSNNNQTKSNDQTESKSGLYKIKNSGMTKATVQGANNAINVDDIFNVFSTHVVEMADYNAYAMPLSDAMKWFNYKVRDSAGRMNTIKGEMERTYGSQAKAYFIQLIKDINGDNGNIIAAELTSSLLGTMKGASVAGNVRVAIQQPTSIARAMVLMDPQYIGLGVTNMLKNPNKAIKEAQEHSAIAKWKSWGYYDSGLGKSLKEVITGQASFRDKFVEKTMILAAYGDKVTWGALWEACKLEVAKNISPDSNGYMEAVTKRFDEIIDKTQVVDTVLHRSQIMRSKDNAVKMATSFMSEPTKTYNLMRNAITDMYHNRTKESVTNFARTTSAVMFTAVLTAAAAALSDAFRDDDKSKDWGEKYIDNFFENIVDNANPLNMVPYIKDIVSVLNGYDVQRNDITGFAGFFQCVKQLFDKIATGKEINFFNTVYDMSRYVSQFTGIPIFNLLREADSVIDIFADPLFRKDKTKAADVYAKLYQALISDNDAETDKMYQKLIEDGKDLQAIESGLRTQLLNPESEIYEDRIVEAAKARLDGNTAEYMRLMKEIIADTGLSQDFWVKTVNTQINRIRNDGKELSEDKEFLIKNGLSAETVESMTEQQIKETVKQYQTSSYKDLTAGDSMSLYDMNDLATAVTKGDTESFKEVYQDILMSKVDELLEKDNLLTMKKAEEKAKSSLKSTITSKLKPVMKELYKTDRDKFHEMRIYLVQNYGYDNKTVNGWTY